ncbi:uncharacterized protein LOC110651185 isoform X3 [Hevea brasiliensis]|uniref:uncharacterized protein LOC110651185 isoform X3 n=1 Tax=Hevea brasiliensis TaxID=3981 RepID=UPI0025EAA611|nr:uncharacterized protein LOC110651185 isoform X3 [Hevea brasiliensis]
MAPKIFSLLVDATLSWVLSLIIYQIILAWNLNDDSKGLQDSLTMIRAVLQDADEQQHRREPVRLWLKKLKDVAYEGEAVLNKLKNDDIRQMVEMLDQSGTELWNFMKGMLGDSLPYSTSRDCEMQDYARRTAALFSLQISAFIHANWKRKKIIQLRRKMNCLLFCFQHVSTLSH